jgi:hypothetical protein
MTDEINYKPLPEHLRAGAKRYLEEGVMPGDFLTAAFCNNLLSAVVLADDEALSRLKEIAMWLHWEVPSSAWGSREKMHMWCENVKKSPLESALSCR